MHYSTNSNQACKQQPSNTKSYRLFAHSDKTMHCFARRTVCRCCSLGVWVANACTLCFLTSRSVIWTLFRQKEWSSRCYAMGEHRSRGCCFKARSAHQTSVTWLSDNPLRLAVVGSSSELSATARGHPSPITCLYVHQT